MITHHDLQRDLDPTPGYERSPDYFQSLSRQYSAELEGLIRGLPLPKPRAVDWDALWYAGAECEARFAKRPFSPLIEGLDYDR